MTSYTDCFTYLLTHSSLFCVIPILHLTIWTFTSVLLFIYHKLLSELVTTTAIHCFTSVTTKKQ